MVLRRNMEEFRTWVLKTLKNIYSKNTIRSAK